MVPPPEYHVLQLTSSCVTVARTNCCSVSSLRASSTSRRTHRSPPSACRNEASHCCTHHSTTIITASAERARPSSPPTVLRPERSTRSAHAEPLAFLRHPAMSSSMRVAQSTTSAQPSVCAARLERPSTATISASTAAITSSRSSSASPSPSSSSSESSSALPDRLRCASLSRKSAFFFCSRSFRSPVARFSFSDVALIATSAAWMKWSPALPPRAESSPLRRRSASVCFLSMSSLVSSPVRRSFCASRCSIRF
mmetsp:Transcript_52106/g.125196  ORF Transcript_52106/g.125196 Transcript_52106/m.125196 type:complete len:254 (-) Transcript_52106:59-820(-)